MCIRDRCKLVVGLGLAYWLVKAGADQSHAAAGAITGVTVGTIVALAYMPVSYTHLDVYKRQVLGGGEEGHVVGVHAAEHLVVGAAELRPGDSLHGGKKVLHALPCLLYTSRSV